MFAVGRFAAAMLLYRWWPPFDFVSGPTNEACPVLSAAESARGVFCEWLLEWAPRTIGIFNARLFLCKNGGKHLATTVGDFRVRVDDDGSNGEFAGDPVRDLQSWTGCICISPDCRPYVAPICGSGELCNLSATFHGNSSSMRLTLWSAM